jgi:hypothetical protein
MAVPIIAMAAASVLTGMYASSKANQAANDAAEDSKRLQSELDMLEATRQPILNPYANMSVATSAAEIQMEEVDMNLATALDTMQAMGTASTAATALAREANKAKLQISADIQKQEAQNEQLKAKGEEFVFQTRENREMQKLDRTAGLLDRSTLQEAQYRSDSTSALTGGVQGALSIGAAAYSPAG